MFFYIIIGSFFVTFIIGIILVIKFSKKGKLSYQRKKFYLEQIKKLSLSSSSYKEQIIDIDKLYHKVLKDLGYSGTFGDILRRKPKEIVNIKKIWELHKLRNQLVHDFDLLNDGLLKKKSQEYNLYFNDLIK